MPRPNKDVTEKGILEEISKRINYWYTSNMQNIKAFRRDKDFLFLDQWDASDRAEFKRLQKPIMTFNKVYDFFKKVVGEQRQNTPNLEVRCILGDCSEEALALRQNIVKKIAFDSRSDICYQTAFENMLAGGFGALRVTTEYESPKSFDQKILLTTVEDPERAFFDPGAHDPTRRDGEYCGFYTTINRDKFEKQYPDIVQPQSFPAQFDMKHFSWGTEDTITIVEYYRKERFTFNLHKLNDGRTVTDKELRKIKNDFASTIEQLDEGTLDIASVSALIEPQIVSTRKSDDCKLMYYKVIFDKILEKKEWPGKEFPLVFMPGDAHSVEGEYRTLSFVRFVKDAQRFLNYCGCEIAQAIKNSRREQFLATPDNVSGQGIADMWRNPANQQGALIAKPDPLTKQMPIKLPPSEVPATLLAQYQRAEMDIQSILGFYEANRGSQGQELSGVALQERQRTGNMGVSVYFDNLDRGIEQVGRIIMSLMPSIYDTQRKVSFENDNGGQQDIILNQPLPGGKVENDVTKGEYDVVLKPGPSFAVQRQQALGVLIDLAKINPEVFPLIADLIAKNIDIDNSPQLVERIKNIVPPEILAKEEGKPPPPQQPNPQMMAAMQEMQIKQEEINIKKQELQLKQQEKQIEAARMQLELEKLESQRQLTGMKAGAELEKAKMDYDSSITNSMAKIMSANTSLHKARHDTIQHVINKA